MSICVPHVSRINIISLKGVVRMRFQPVGQKTYHNIVKLMCVRFWPAFSNSCLVSTAVRCVFALTVQ